MYIENNDVAVYNNNTEINTTVEENENIITSLRRSIRNIIPPTYLQDFEVSNLNNNNVNTKYPFITF